MEKTAAMMQAELRAIAGMVKSNGSLSENQKQIMAVQFLNVVGVDWMKRFLLGAEQHVVSTPGGLQKLTVSGTPSPVEMVVSTLQKYENGQLSEEDFNNALKNYLDIQRRRFKDNEPNSAVEQSKEALVHSTVAPGVVQYAPARV
jgi:hypothetical protein